MPQPNILPPAIARTAIVSYLNRSKTTDPVTGAVFMSKQARLL